jgi:signal transduction histidine kinase/tetratricopeptide (TPR) repeat protein/ActR/RegA family two-component response regulator
MRKNVVTLLLFLSVLSGYSQTNEKKIIEKEKEAFELLNKAKYINAIQLAQETLKQSLVIKNDSLIANSYNILGIAYAELKDNIAAIEYFKKTIIHFEKAKLKSQVLIAKNNLGVAIESSGDLKKSLSYFLEVLKSARELNDKRALVYPLYNCGYLNRKLGHYKEALPYLDESLSYSLELKLYYSSIEAYFSLGYCHFKLGDYKKSENYFEQGIKISKKKDYKQPLAEIYNIRGELYLEIKDYKKATENLILEKKIVEEINLSSEKKIKDQLEFKYKLKENKEKIALISSREKIKEKLLNTSRFYNIFFLLLTLLLLISLFHIYLKNKKIKIATRKTEELAKAKSAFYSEISHELRTPLYAVIELSNFLMQENPKESQKKYLASLKFSGDYLLSLINNVLELNKLDSTNSKIEEFNFNLKDLIHHIIESVNYAISENNCKIIVHYDNSIPEHIIGDKLKLSQVIINLLSNAAKFTKDGTITLTVKKIKETIDDISLYFNITDTGIGIHPDRQKDVFKDYYQEQNTNKMKTRGTGLGLYIVKKTLAFLDSDISLKSELGVGSEFSFEIIFRKHLNVELSSNTAKINIESMSKYKFLVVDDNKINLLITKKIIKQFNAPCDTSSNGRNAVELIKQNHYDCVYLDLNMDGLDGFETAKEIRKFDRKISIIALTAALSGGLTPELVAAGFDNIITKPFLTDSFVEITVQTILDSKKQS